MRQASQAARTLLQQALRYAEQGWPVFPVWPRGKNPLTPHGVKDATTDQATVEHWWRRWPKANIGLPVPVGYLVLDVDSEEALQSLKHQGLEIPSTSTARTSRGWHFWYSVSRPVKNGVDVLPNIDIRASGGYVIAPPSVHTSGSIYRWEVSLAQDTITECPEWLLKRLATRKRQHRGRPVKEWHELISMPVSEGRRNQTLTEVAGLLFRRLPTELAAELAHCWAAVKLQPALPDDEVSRTIDSIAGREQRRRADRLPSPRAEARRTGPADAN